MSFLFSYNKNIFYVRIKTNKLDRVRNLIENLFDLSLIYNINPFIP